MANVMRLFHFCENEVRTVVVDGQPWFAIMDVCNELELRNPTMTLKRLDEDEVTKFNLGGLEGETNFVNEYGLYNLILGSRKSEAKAFKKWITHEVIPSIRKHGAYLTDDVLAKTMRDPSYILGLISNLAEEQNKRIAAEQIIEFQALKVEAYDSFITAENTMTMTQVGKSLGISGIKLYEFLRSIGILLKMPYNAPAQKYLDKGYFKVIESKVME